MKRALWVFMNLFILTNFLYSLGKKEIVFRPIALHIFDEQTKKPLKGVNVKVSNIIFYEKIYHFFWFPIDSDVRKTYFPIEEFITDDEGRVQIPKYTYKVQNKFYLYGQFIYINIENNKEDLRNKIEGYSGAVFYDQENKNYFRPLEQYKATLILSRPYLPKEEFLNKQPERTKPYITIIEDGHPYTPLLKNPPYVLNCHHEGFKVYLEHYIEQ